MPTERLKNLLKDLQTELDQTEDLDPNTEQRLRSAVADITTSITDPDAPSPKEPEGLLDEILAADQRFEIAHPRISSTLRQIMASLSSMGI